MNAIIMALHRAGLLHRKQIYKIVDDYTAAWDAKGWSANLSYKTYQALKAQGVME